MITIKSHKIYSSIFLTVTLSMLLSLVTVRELSLTTLSENFRWRKDLIELYTSLRFKLGDRVFNNAIVGSNGWIFYTGELSMDDYQNTIPMSPKKLSNLQKSLDRLSQDLEEKNITLIVVVPPNKTTIYPQFMPDEIPILNKASRLDQFIEYMKENGNTTIVDLRPTLQSASLSQDVYSKTDTHWNALGAYYGYFEIMNVLSEKYPGIKPHPLSDFEYENVGYAVRDIPRIMGLPHYEEEDWVLIPQFKVDHDVTNVVLSDGVHYIRTVVNSDGNLPALLVYGDSFYGRLAQFVEPHFSRVKTIPLSTQEGIWSLDWIQREAPDIVIVEFVERYLDVSLPLLLTK